MRRKPAIFILITLALLSGCQGHSISTVVTPAIKSSITGLTALDVDQPSADSIRQRMGLFLKSNPYSQFMSGSQLLLYLVSSGEFDQAELTLEGGETYQGDVLYAYALMRSKQVLVAPVLVGLLLPDGNYIYFSEKYAFETGDGIASTSVDRQTALADAEERLPRGRIIRLLAYGITTRQGLDWKKCPSGSFYPPEICPVGELIEQLFPNHTKTFLLRLADSFPANWLLAAWVFQRFTQEELLPGASVDVPLPGPSQP